MPANLSADIADLNACAQATVLLPKPNDEHI
jgi:hypothetical protein